MSKDSKHSWALVDRFFRRVSPTEVCDFVEMRGLIEHIRHSGDDDSTYGSTSLNMLVITRESSERRRRHTGSIRVEQVGNTLIFEFFDPRKGKFEVVRQTTGADFKDALRECIDRLLGTGI